MSRTKNNQHNLRQIAIWVDHREAILVILKDAHLLREKEIFSEAGPHTHGGGWSQKRIEAHRHTVLELYYDEIAQNLTRADEIIIYGPGQAKHELYQHINHNKVLGQRVIDLVTTDKLSEQEFIRKAINDITSAHTIQSN